MAGEISGEFRGKTVEAAVTAGLATLKLAREDVEVEVVRQGSRGVLGIGAEDAIVRLSTVRSALLSPGPRPRPNHKAKRGPRRLRCQEPKPAPQVAQPAPPAEPKVSTPAAGTSDERVRRLQPKRDASCPTGLLERMNLAAQVEIVPQSAAEVDDDEPALVLNIVGDNLGVLIGRQNETLSALEFVTRLMVNQQVRRGPTSWSTSMATEQNGPSRSASWRCAWPSRSVSQDAP